jgi:hypothetical protein
MIIFLASIKYSDLVGFIILVMIPFFIGLLAIVPANYSGSILNKKFDEEHYG